MSKFQYKLARDGQNKQYLRGGYITKLRSVSKCTCRSSECGGDEDDDGEHVDAGADRGGALRGLEVDWDVVWGEAEFVLAVWGMMNGKRGWMG